MKLLWKKSPPYSLLPYTIGVSEELELGCFCRCPGFCWQSIVEASKGEQSRRNWGCRGGQLAPSDFSKQIRTNLFLQKALNYRLHPQIFRTSKGSKEEARAEPLELGLQGGTIGPSNLNRHTSKVFLFKRSLNYYRIYITFTPTRFLELPTASKEETRAPLLCQRGGLHALNGRTNERTGGRVVG